MSARILKTQRDLWPIGLLLVLLAAVPTLGVLWFMNEALRNENLAIQQQLTEACRAELERVRVRVQNEFGGLVWRYGAIAASKDTPWRRVRKMALIEGDDIGAIVLGADGSVVYPTVPQSESIEEEAPRLWNEGQRAEHEEGLPAEAASRYEKLAAAADPKWRARAIQARARCLDKCGRTSEAIRLLTRLAEDKTLAGQRDAQGRSIAADALLRTVEILMGSPGESKGKDHEIARALDALDRFIREDEALASTQRVFLMEQMEQLKLPRLIPESAVSRRWEAQRNGHSPESPVSRYDEGLSLRWREAALRRFAGKISLTPGLQRDTLLGGSDHFMLYLAEERTVLLLNTRSLGRFFSNALCLPDERRSPPEGAIYAMPPGWDLSGSVSMQRMLLPGVMPAQGAPLVETPLEGGLTGWRIGLWLQGSASLHAAERRTLQHYLMLAGLMLAGCLGMALLIGGKVGRQMKLTQLRNDFIATVSHELKTPLSSMRVLVDTLLEGHLEDQALAREYLELIARENLRLSRLVENFLTFSRMERGKVNFEMGQVPVEALFESAREAVAERFESARVAFEVSVDPGLAPLAGDRDALLTVVLNLLDNAFKYSGARKTIALRAAAAGEGRVAIEVRDDGIGLTRRAMRRVFDRFYQADQTLSRAAGGCGLGLSIVKFIVKAHGGEVAVESRPGEGSVFRVLLPSASRDEGDANAKFDVISTGGKDEA